MGHSTLKALIAACNVMPASRAKATDGLQESRKKRVYAQVFDANLKVSRCTVRYRSTGLVLQLGIVQPDGTTGPADASASEPLLSCPVCLVSGFVTEASVNAQSGLMPIFLTTLFSRIVSSESTGSAV